MFVDKGEFLVLQEFLEFGIFAGYTKKSFGNIMKMSEIDIKKKLNFEDFQLFHCHQTHSSNVGIITTSSPKCTPNCDGLITNDKKILLMTKYADCLPIFILDKNKKIISTIHSGWKGSFDTIIFSAIEKFQKNFSSSKEDLIFAFGINISPKNYIVGKEFFDNFKNKFSEFVIKESFIFENDNYYFDNQSFNRALLLDKGFKDKQIITNNHCTFDEEFHSHRRDRELSGRNGAFSCIL